MKIKILVIILFILTNSSCNKDKKIMSKEQTNIIFLHHSTGKGVWRGNVNKYIHKLTKLSGVENLIKKYNKANSTNYKIKEQIFPKKDPYGWNNYPFDYYNIWVKNAGDKPFMEEPTLELLTKDYNVIIFKHCFPVSRILEDDTINSLDAEKKTIGNYKLHYNALKKKLHEFPETKFILWTGAALTKAKTNEEEAKRALEFFNWVRNEWNESEDNIYLWDFRQLETQGGLYLKEEYAASPTDSHPNDAFNKVAAKLFVSRLTDIIENDGNKTSLIGENI